MKDTEAHEDGELLNTGNKVEWVEEPKDDLDESEDTHDLDEADDSVSDTEEHQGDAADDSEDEQQQDADFDLEEPEGLEDKKSNKESAEQVKQRQLNAWERDIKAGKKSLDDLPANLQWMKSELESRVSDESIQEDDDIDARIDQRLKEREDMKVFESLKKQIPDVADPKKQKGIREDYTLNRKEGLSPRRALELAMKANGVSPSDFPKRKQGVRIPRSGYLPTVSKNLTNQQIAELESKHGWDAVRKKLTPQQQDKYLDWQGQDRNQYF